MVIALSNYEIPSKVTAPLASPVIAIIYHPSAENLRELSPCCQVIYTEQDGQDVAFSYEVES